MNLQQRLLKLMFLAAIFAMGILIAVPATFAESPAGEPENKILKRDQPKDFQCGDVFVDPRDGQSYNTVLIGEQCWMAENLNYGVRIDAAINMTDNGIVEKYCYDDDPANCDLYGGHYQWNEMMNHTILEGYRGICPEGWHVPSDADWCALELAVDPTINCNAIFWRGADGGTKLKCGGSSGFEGLLAGQVYTFSSHLEEFAYFWTSSQYSEYWSYYRGLGATNSGVRRWYTSKGYGYSVRCVQGEGAINQPPSVPSNPTPTNGATNQLVGIDLMWECVDPEGDAITYTIYFGTETNPPLAATGVTGATYFVGSLQYLTTYYWKIVATDNQGNSTEGPVWSFVTQPQSGFFTCGQVLTDSRDGQQYTTVKIGELCWMAKNMNIGQQINSSQQMTDNGIIEKYCYENDPANCNTFGGLYSWNEMMQYSTQQGSTGICPSGWRLPTDNEWKILEGIADSQYPIGDPIWDELSWRGSDVGGNLKQVGTTNWNAPNNGATNSTGFTALPGGYVSGNSFLSKGIMGWYWTSTQVSSSNAISRTLHSSLTTVLRAEYGKALATSVRCIQSNVMPNEPPSTPASPSPANGATGQVLEPELSWVSTDPDGDPVTFDVYFGTNENPPLVAEGIDENSYLPGLLDYKTTYYWKIVAHDDQGNSATGPVWSFMTTPLFFTVTFTIEDESGNPLNNAVVTLDGVTNPANNYVFDEVEEGTYDYSVILENYVPTYGEVTVIDQNVGVTVLMPELVTITAFPFNEDFSGGALPPGWLNIKTSGDFGWEFALNPFPHTFIHNISRPAVHARLITPLLDAGDLGQVTLGINQRFMVEPSGGTASILISEDGNNWQVIYEYMASIGSGNEFEYTEFNINTLAAGKQVWIALSADFPDTDANYEAVWEVESFAVFEPDYAVTFFVEDANGNAIADAVIALDGNANPAGNYVFENLLAGTYPYITKADGFMDNYGFVTLEDQSITETVVMKDLLVISEFPYIQDFNENVLPDGWNNIILGDPEGYWRFQEERAQMQSGWGDRTHAMLVSPAFDCSNMSAVAVGLNHYYMDIYGVGFAEIVVSTDGENWNTIVKFQGESVGGIPFPYFEYYATEYAAGHEQVFIGLLYDDLASTEFWWLVDAFTFFEPMPYDLSVENLSGNQYLQEGESFIYEFEIVNKGGENDTYSLEVLNAEWDFELSAQTISINAGQSAVVTVEVTAPFDLEMGTKNEMILKAVSQGNPDKSAQDDFTTIAISTIKAYYFEDFDLAEVPALPGGWSKIVQSSAYWARVQTVKSTGIAPVSPPNNVEMYNSSDMNANLILISPMIDESVDLKDFRLLFKLRTGTSSGVMVGTMDSPTGTFTERQAYSSPEHFNWIYCMHLFDDYQGTDRYIAFKMTFTDTNRSSNLDDITIEIIPPPILQVTPESHDFGEYWVNYPSEVPLSVDLRNIGYDVLTINNINLDNSDDFSVDKNTVFPVQLNWDQFIVIDVYFNASSPGAKTGNLVINYFDVEPKTMHIPLQGIGIPRPQGSTCDDPIALQLPVIDYTGSTLEHGNDFGINWVNPGTNYLGGYDMVFSFTIEEESYLTGSIEGPYYGPGLQIVNACPHPIYRPNVFARAQGVYGGSFEDVILPAGNYLAIVGSPAPSSSWPYYTTFTLNLSAEPTPNLYEITFELIEDSPEQLPVAIADIYVTGFQTNLLLTTNMVGQAYTSLYEGEYSVYVYKKDYEVHEFTFAPLSDTVVNIIMKDLIWTPHSLNVVTEGLQPGQAHFSWMPKPLGDPWAEGFETNYPPNGWDTIVTNNGQVEEPGVDWKFTWQKYGTVYFLDATAHPKEGNHQAFVHWSTDPQDEWLISHEFEAPAGDLEFWYFGPNGAPFGDYFLKISNDGGATWFNAWNASDLPSGRNNYDYPAIVDLQPWAGENIRLAWNAYGPDYGIYGAWCIDKITVGEQRINTEDLIFVSNIKKPIIENLSGTIPSIRDEAILPKVKPGDMNYNLSENRVNQGFSIYLNDMENPVATGVQAPEFMFIGLAMGDYLAGVQAVYTTGQSEVVTIPFFNPVNPLSYDVSFAVADDSGIPVDNATIEVKYAGTLIHTLITQNGLANVQLFPGDYDFVVTKQNFKTYKDSFTVSNIAINIEVVLQEGYQVEFLVINNDQLPIQGATVFLNGMATITDADGSAAYELEPGVYPYSVTHPDYDPVFSSLTVNMSDVLQVVMNDLTCEEPQNLDAQLIAGHAYLQWEAPVIGMNGTWLHWDVDHSNNSIGTGNAIDFDVAQRFSAIDVRPYDGSFLTRILFVPHEVACSYAVRVWIGGSAGNAGILVVDQEIINPVIGQWNEIFLQTPVYIDDNYELWIGFRSNTTKGYPAGVDGGPAINGKGNMIKLPGNNWKTLLEVNPALNYNWSIRGLVEEPTGKHATLLPALQDKERASFSGELSVTNNPSNRSVSQPRLLLGYNVYRDNVLLNTGIIDDNEFMDTNTPFGAADYNVTSLWSNGCESEFSNTAVITNFVQQFAFTAGWNSMSAFITPDNPEIVGLLSSLADNLIIMQNLSGYYWPAQGANTLIDFDNASGYVLKLNDDADFIINGNGMASNEVTLETGWNYLPALSQCDVDILSLLGDQIDNVIIIQELIGVKVFWPEMGVYSLTHLKPGSAYAVKTSNPVFLEFPECDSKTMLEPAKSVNMLNTIWGEMVMTPFTQPVVFKAEAIEQLAEGDVIGAFGTNNNLSGFVEINGISDNQSLMLFGNSIANIGENGFTEGERVSYRLYRTATGEDFDLEVEYDPTLNATGNYHSGAFAAVVKTAMKPSEVKQLSTTSFRMYPNPADEAVWINWDGGAQEEISIVIYDAKGQVAVSETFTQSLRLNTGSLDAGVYFVKISAQTHNEVRKLIIQ